MKLPSFKLKHLFSLRREEAFHAGFRTRDPNVIDSENTCTASYASLCGAASRGRSEERKEEDKVKEMSGKERRNRYRKASRNRFTGSKFQGPRVATKPQRKLFLEGHLPRRSRRSNRTENTEPRTDNGWTWTTRPPGSLSSSSSSSTPFLSLSLACSSLQKQQRAPVRNGQGSFINRLVLSTLSRSITATFDHFLTWSNPERKGGRWSQGLNRGIEDRIAWKVVIKRETDLSPIRWDFRFNNPWLRASVAFNKAIFNKGREGNLWKLGNKGIIYR